MAVIMQSNTLDGIATLTVGPGSTELNGVSYAPTMSAGNKSVNIATTEFVAKTGTRPSIDYVSTGTYNSFFILSNGIIYEAHGTVSAGNYTNGSTDSGNMLVTGVDRATAIPIPSSSPVIQIAGGMQDWAAALCANGNLYTWGYNSNGGCGLGNTSYTNNPTLAATGVAQIYEHPTQGNYSIGNAPLYIRKTDGYIYATGYNGYGQLGVGDTTNRSTFTQIPTIGANPTFFSPFGSHLGGFVAQRASDKTIWVAGYNGYGQLGTTDTSNRSSPTNVTAQWNNTGDSTYILRSVHGGFGYSTSSAASYCSLAMLFDNGTGTFIKSCGDNNWSQLGSGGTSATYTPYLPWAITTGSNRVKKVMWQGDCVGGFFILLENGNLYGHGYNGYGQLGNGNETTLTSPTLVQTGVIDLPREQNEYAYGHYHTSFCIKADGLYACGINNYGQCGVGDTSNKNTWTKVNVPGNVTGAKIKFLGQTSTTGSTRQYVLVTTDNTMWVWGYNGQYFCYPWHSVSYVPPTQFELTRGD